jgi:hypothetical protein
LVARRAELRDDLEAPADIGLRSLGGEEGHWP